jgi:type I restriction enzyme, S subunit
MEVVTTNKVRSGYKQTEIGTIPEDWDVKTLEEGIKLLSGQHVLAHNCNTDGIGFPYITGPADFPNGVIQQSKFTDKPTTICRANDILVTVKGSGAGTLVLSDAEYCISRQLMAVRVIDWNTIYIYLALLQDSSLFGAAATGLIPGLSRSDILKKQIAVPPLPEQRAIAAALSDVDDLIGTLDRIVAKKRDLKQAAMQQLLTGKRRLSGFSGGWEVKRLGDMGVFRGGNGFPLKYQGKVEGDYPFFKVSDMNNDGNATFMVNSNNWISETIRKAVGAATFPANSIVFAKIGAAIFLERKKILSQEGCIDNNMMGFIPIGSVSHYTFIHYLLLSIHLGRFVSTTALSSLSGNELAHLEYPFPSLTEQIAIATVLSDMDAEIAALEQRRDKTRALKQGMMQELLTGKTRLI